MSSAFCKRVDLLMLRNRVFRERNVQIWSVMSSNKVDLLMLRNRVFSLRNIQKLAVLCSREFHFLMLRNPVYRLGNFQKWAESSARGWFADAQELRFQAANRSNTGNVVLQGGRLASSQ